MMPIRTLVLICAALFSWSAVADVIDRDFPTISYVSWTSENVVSPDTPLTLSAQLRIPPHESDDTPIPAVVVLHGSAGLDSRGGFYVEALNAAGIATLELDMWSARGLAGGGDRPALPTLTVPDAFSALRHLAEHPSIDPLRIGILGFSWGGVVSMLAATRPYTEEYGDGLSFAAHVAHYPICWGYDAGLPGIAFDDPTGSPVLIQIGEWDDYDDGADACQALADPFANVSVNVYRKAYHGWDRLQPAITVTDPFAHRGLGGEVEIAPNLVAAHRSRHAVVRFFETEIAGGIGLRRPIF